MKTKKIKNKKKNILQINIDYYEDGEILKHCTNVAEIVRFIEEWENQLRAWRKHEDIKAFSSNIEDVFYKIEQEYYQLKQEYEI